MAIHIQNDETEWLVRDFAQRRGLGITAAIKAAVQEASAREERHLEDYRRRIEPIIENMRTLKRANG